MSVDDEDAAKSDRIPTQMVPGSAAPRPPSSPPPAVEDALPTMPPDAVDPRQALTQAPDADPFAAGAFEGDATAPPGAVDPAHAKTQAPGGRAPSGASGRVPSGSGGLRSSAMERRGQLVEGQVYAGKYELLHEIARGGMGAVYKARQVDLNKVVALKVMLAGAVATADQRSRFRREAEAAARLQHPNIVPVFDIDEVEGNLYFTQEFVSGQPLSKRKAALSPAKLRDVMIQVCEGVHHAHTHGVIHRDLKPDNIMMDAADVPKIMDFGLAKQVDLADEAGKPSVVTHEGSVMGTPHYMPPEQADGSISEIDARSDVYSLGVILYELFCGQLPFQAKGLPELLVKIFRHDPVRPRQLDPGIDPDIEAIILKALEKEKPRRYQTAAELGEDLERQRDGQPITARRATITYRLGKWARRWRRGIAAGLVVTAAIAASAGVAIRSYLRAERTSEEQLQARLDGATRESTRRAGAATTLASRAGALFSAGLVERRAQAPGLAGALERERAAVGEALGGLKEFEARPEAREPLRALEEADRTALQPAATRVRRLVETHALLAAAPGLQRAAEAACDAATRALEGGTAAAVGSWATLRAALAPCEALLAGSQEQAGPLLGAAFEERQAAFERALQDGRKSAFAALKGAEEPSPEVDAAAAALDALDAVRRRFEAARSGALSVRTADAMLAAATGLLASLAADEAAQQPERLRGARLAQALVQRGLEADPRREALQALRRAANAAYARALLDMGAFALVTGLLEEASFSLDDPDRAALVRDHAAALEGKERCEAQLNELVTGTADLSVAALGDRLARVAALEAAARRYGLDGLRLQRRGDLERARTDRARAELEQALTVARGAEVLPARDQFLQLRPLLEAWVRARDACEALKAHLPAPLRAQRLAECELGQARLHLQAALGREAEEPEDARRLAREAAARAGQVAASDAPAAERAAAAEQVEAAAAVVARLDAVIAARERRSNAPPGMVLIPGTAGREVQLGDANVPRNREHKAKVAAFYLAIHEVSNRAYQAFVESEAFGSDAHWTALGVDRARDGVQPPRGWSEGRFPAGEADLPVTGITLAEARGYAAFRQQRLPTDAEWEVAASYGSDGEAAQVRRRYPWGTDWSAGLLTAALRPPGSNPKDASPQGVLDLGGNASEWVLGADGPAARGASWLYPFEQLARSVSRLRPDVAYQGPQLGLRLAQDVPR